MREYDYDKAHDMVVLAAVIKIWESPAWAGPYTPDGQGNCIRAARFAHGVLDLLNLECEVAAMRVHAPPSDTKKYSTSIGWGDCGAYARSETGFPAHAVVIGHDWLFDAAAEQVGASGPVVALPTGRSEWATDTGIQYTWAPGMRHEIDNTRDWGWKTPATRLVRDVRKIAGPCRKQRGWGPMGF